MGSDQPLSDTGESSSVDSQLSGSTSPVKPTSRRVLVISKTSAILSRFTTASFNSDAACSSPGIKSFLIALAVLLSSPKTLKRHKIVPAVKTI